jgi:hypothetical protein
VKATALRPNRHFHGKHEAPLQNARRHPGRDPQERLPLHAKSKNQTGSIIIVTAEKSSLVETEIRRIVDQQGTAVRARDVEGVMSNCASDVVSFDVVGGLQKIGANERRKRAEDWFSSFEGDISKVRLD